MDFLLKSSTFLTMLPLFLTIIVAIIFVCINYILNTRADTENIIYVMILTFISLNTLRYFDDKTIHPFENINLSSYGRL